MTDDKWTKKRKGNARIHLHPATYQRRGVVENFLGYHFNGKTYPTLEAAKKAALDMGKAARRKGRPRPEPKCVNAHDRCYGGAGGPCPYCE